MNSLFLELTHVILSIFGLSLPPTYFFFFSLLDLHYREILISWSSMFWLPQTEGSIPYRPVLYFVLTVWISSLPFTEQDLLTKALKKNNELQTYLLCRNPKDLGEWAWGEWEVKVDFLQSPIVCIIVQASIYVAFMMQLRQYSHWNGVRCLQTAHPHTLPVW